MTSKRLFRTWFVCFACPSPRWRWKIPQAVCSSAFIATFCPARRDVCCRFCASGMQWGSQEQTQNSSTLSSVEFSEPGEELLPEGQTQEPSEISALDKHSRMRMPILILSRIVFPGSLNSNTGLNVRQEKTILLPLNYFNLISHAFHLKVVHSVLF